MPSERKCYCRECKNAPGNSATWNKYGGEGHCDACVCERCLRLFRDHNRAKTCVCADCLAHRAYLYNDKQKATGTPDSYRGEPMPGRQKKVSTINMCERCGAMAVSTAMGGIQTWDFPQDSLAPAVELCPGCVGDLKQFMKGEDVGDRPKNGYRKPWEAPKSDLGTVSTEDLAKALLTRQIESGGFSE